MTLPNGARDFFCEFHACHPVRHPGQKPTTEERGEGEERREVEKTEQTETKENKPEENMDKVKEEKEDNEEEEKEKEKEKEEGRVTCAADLLIVLGTSLAVAPVASLVDEVHWLCPRLLINREKVHLHGGPKPEWPPQMGPDNGFRFDNEDNYRDVASVQDCDAGTRELAALLGWESELDALIAAAAES